MSQRMNVSGARRFIDDAPVIIGTNFSNTAGDRNVCAHNFLSAIVAEGIELQEEPRAAHNSICHRDFRGVAVVNEDGRSVALLWFEREDTARRDDERSEQHEGTPSQLLRGA